MAGRFYVYALLDAGTPVYIGKGVGSRLQHQKATSRLDGIILRRFDNQGDAFRFERAVIKQIGLKNLRNKTDRITGSWSKDAEKPIAPISREKIRTLFPGFARIFHQAKGFGGKVYVLNVEVPGFLHDMLSMFRQSFVEDDLRDELKAYGVTI